MATGISKTFDGSRALDSLDLTISPGEIHALLGENGSGKSTFIKILSGFHTPDPGGVVMVGGERLPLGSSASSYQLGCRFVHQDLGLIETSSVLDNLCLSSGYPAKWGTIRESIARRQAVVDLQRVGLDLDPRLPVGSLSPAVQTGIAVARAIRTDEHTHATLLVLDEPTATLPESAVRQLIEIVRRVAHAGVGVLYVSHRIDEVLDLADNATVLRDGRKIAHRRVADLDRRSLVTMLVGRDFDEVRSGARAASARVAAPILEVRSLGSGPIRDVSFSAGAGDVVGIAGLTGSGRETLLSAVFGRVEREAGSVFLDGQALPPMRPDLSIGAGMAFLPSERRLHGGIMEHSARENLTLADLRGFWRWPRLRKRPEVEEASRWFDRLSVRPGGAMEERLATFSGGNQQKVLFAKWLRIQPRVLLLDEPTQGVDVATKSELHQHVLDAAEAGVAVVVSSSDVDELAAICSRVLVLIDGRIAAELEGEHITLSNISHESFGTGWGVVA